MTNWIARTLVCLAVAPVRDATARTASGKDLSWQAIGPQGGTEPAGERWVRGPGASVSAVAGSAGAMEITVTYAVAPVRPWR